MDTRNHLSSARRAPGWAATLAPPAMGMLPTRIPCRKQQNGRRRPARAAARGGRAPCTPGHGRCPLEPQFDACVCQALMHMPTGRSGWEKSKMSRHNGGMSDCVIVRLTSIAGGLGGSKPAQRGARRVPSGCRARSHAPERTCCVSSVGQCSPASARPQSGGLCSHYAANITCRYFVVSRVSEGKLDATTLNRPDRRL
jgi:hypothetical protein